MTSQRTELVSGRQKLRHHRQRILALLSVIAVLATAGVTSSAVSPAWAADYPSWNDVVQARKSVTASAAKVAEIKELLRGLQAEVERTQAVALEKGEAFQAAEQKYFEAEFKAGELQAQADAAAAKAEESTLRAGQIAAQLQRSGGGDVPMTLFFDGDNAGNLLSNIGRANLVREQSEAIYATATQDKNTAQALTDQADVAKVILEELKLVAEAAFQEAQTAALAAEDALAASEAHRAELEAQLAALTTNLQATEADYATGVAVRAAAAKAAADKAAAEAAAGAPISNSGWSRPTAGSITSPFGWRLDPIYGVNRYHGGTDVAAGCNVPIYATQSGTVTYAGAYGTYGNFILINHSDGIQSGYAHIVNGGILVSYGQVVGSGQLIARTGTTGRSTGCHLHFEVRRNGGQIDPVAFLRDRGITLG